MEYIQPCSNLFDRRRRRRRVRVLIGLIIFFSGVTLGLLFTASAQPQPSTAAQSPAELGAQKTGQADNDAFARLVMSPGLLEDRMGAAGPQLYDISGTNIRIRLERDGRRAMIEILCEGDAQGCENSVGKRYRLIADQAGRGDLVFKSEAGVPVLRITAIGGATLFGGAPFVPSSIPSTGRAVVPVP